MGHSGAFYSCRTGEVLSDCLCFAVKRQVDILELKDLEKEYILSRSRLTLAQHHPPSAAIAGKHPTTTTLTINMFNTNLVNPFI